VADQVAADLDAVVVAVGGVVPPTICDGGSAKNSATSPKVAARLALSASRLPSLALARTPLAFCPAARRHCGVARVAAWPG
jgi:hypothetical protein